MQNFHYDLSNPKHMQIPAIVLVAQNTSIILFQNNSKKMQYFHKKKCKIKMSNIIYIQLSTKSFITVIVNTNKYFQIYNPKSTVFHINIFSLLRLN